MEDLIGSQYAFKTEFLVCFEFPSEYIMKIQDNWDFIITSSDNMNKIEKLSKWAEKNNKIFFISKYPYQESLYNYRNTLSFPVSYNNIANFSAEKLALDLSISFKYRNWKNVKSLSQYYRMNNGELLYEALRRNISKSRFGYIGTL